ncbi:MAG: DUF1304 domain-containing protein [bacterium]|nr:DUF1304 domain-containing protein [bacterium]
MQLLSKILTGAVAALHVYILILEMFLWQTERGMKAFGTTPEFAAESAVLAANQGLYNGFLAAGLFWALLFLKDHMQFSVQCFFLGCVIVAGLYGGYTAKPSIYFIQALPAALALGATLLARRSVA